jgi:hypothetical protein
MFDLTEAMVAYTTYPHVDMAETGSEGCAGAGQYFGRGKKPEKAYPPTSLSDSAHLAMLDARAVALDLCRRRAN